MGALPVAGQGSVGRALLRRALINVISNALRHTPARGRVCVDATDSGAAVLVTITDTGEGIAPELLPRIFDRYVHDPHVNARTSPGAGLGLAIVRGIMTLHGGLATASSTPGHGTAVTLALPREHASAPRAPTAAGRTAAEIDLQRT